VNVKENQRDNHEERIERHGQQWTQNTKQKQTKQKTLQNLKT